MTDRITTAQKMIPTCSRCLAALALKVVFSLEHRPKETDEEEDESDELVVPPPVQFRVPDLAMEDAVTTPTFSEPHTIVDDSPEFFRSLVRDVGAWARTNFGDNAKNPPHRQALGMIEELGELAEGFELRNLGDSLDAIGDIIIYMADFHARKGWDMGKAWELRNYTEDYVNLTTSQVLFSLMGKVAHHQLKGEQNIRGGTDHHDRELQGTCSAILACLEDFCRFFSTDIETVTKQVASKVLKRDWIANPDTAAHISEAEAASHASPG